MPTFVNKNQFVYHYHHLTYYYFSFLVFNNYNKLHNQYLFFAFANKNEVFGLNILFKNSNLN